MSANPKRTSGVRPEEGGPFSVLRFASLDSTNEEALRQLKAGARPPLWIVADEQTCGRGRSGRAWRSPRGNLYASLLLITQAPPATATQLSFVAGVAAHDAVASLIAAERLPGLKLKWPNDLMLDGAKVAGVLLESLQAPGGKGLAVVLGAGVNLSEAPVDIGRAAIHLGLQPSASATAEAFDSLAAACNRWLQVWNEGRGFAAVRAAWLERALALGEPIAVNLNGAMLEGTFKGLSPGGALELETKPGIVITVTAGDVFTGAAR